MPRDGTKTRERILDATQTEVLKKGFAATSVDDIQQAAGISRGTFFYHFPSKDDLARTLIERYAEADRALVESMKERAEKLASDPLQQALIFVALHEDMMEDVAPEEAGCLFASYSYEAIEHWRSVLGGKLEEAMKRHGTVVPDVDPYLLADMGYAVLQGAFILRRSLSDAGLMARHTREFRRYLELLFGVVPSTVGSTDSVPAAASGRDGD
jgi:TetR/AcrR family transcriptional repressor of nem operon